MDAHTVVVWLVDDDPLIRKLADHQVGSDAVRCVTFESGEALLAATDQPSPGIVVIDKEMPVMDGLELGQRVRAGGYSGPMILWTASPGRHVAAAAVEAGFDRTVSKAISLRSLLGELGMAA